jgi:hypothetical protein
MSGEESGVAAKKLVPAAAESGTTAIRRVRLAKALAAKRKKQKPGGRRYKLADDEYAQLTALKQRLESLGSSIAYFA